MFAIHFRNSSNIDARAGRTSSPQALWSESSSTGMSKNFNLWINITKEFINDKLSIDILKYLSGYLGGITLDCATRGLLKYLGCKTQFFLNFQEMRPTLKDAFVLLFQLLKAHVPQNFEFYTSICRSIHLVNPRTSGLPSFCTFFQMCQFKR